MCIHCFALGRCIQSIHAYLWVLHPASKPALKAQVLWEMAGPTAHWNWGELGGERLVLPMPWGRAALLSSYRSA